ncbi:ATP-binding cassette domain-containing protein [Atopobium fossor]|uniref:ATP-binding cassette domain-containing protein n=1 Tax=Atopobium fossor TaxID=39487 RepID=UPI00040DB269|nr:ATP-binding cassette domain-containing protein [Atopobium fossor]
MQSSEKHNVIGVLSGGILVRIGAVALWLVVWQFVASVIGNDLILVGPLVAVERLVHIMVSETFIPVVSFSFVRIALGFCIAFVVACALGVGASYSKLLKMVLQPVVSMLKSTPIVCIIVVLLIWVGSASVSGIAVFLVVFPAIYLATLQGIESSSHDMRCLLEVFDVGLVHQFLVDGYQQVLPYLIATSKNACGMAWKAGVAAELIGTPAGSMGLFIYQAKLLFEVGDVFAWTIAIVALSWFSEKCFVWLLTQSGTWALRLALPRYVETAYIDKADAKTLVHFQKATLGYDGNATATDFDFTLNMGNRVVVCDPSGTGKTTLINTIAGIIPLIQGQMNSASELRISLMSQQSLLIEALSAVQNVQLICGARITEHDIRAVLSELLSQDETSDLLDKPVCQLSGGQRRRVELVRALLHDSQLVLLDEPFSSLDAAAHEHAAQFVLKHLHGRALLVASHATKEAQLLNATALELFNNKP